jgi:type VI secretion system secreted protein VgrG
MKRLIRWAFALCVLQLGSASASASSLPGTRRLPSGKPLPSRVRFAAEYRELGSTSWRKSFPNLGKRYLVYGRSTPGKKDGSYNCIAHTLRIYDKWVWPGHKVSDFDRLYRRFGFRRVKGLNFARSTRYEKIVLYGKVEKGRLKATHGALQQPNGLWTSKLGQGPLIKHPSPHSLTGPSYGRPIAVYVRPRR